MAADKPEVAGEDLLIERADLGPESYTAVNKGDPIPPDLVDLPRRPRAEVLPAPKTSPRRAASSAKPAEG
jgi:hypothetical protein